VGLGRALALLGVGIAVLDGELTREDVAMGRLRRVLPDWSLSPIQVHAITETRLLPARTRLFIDFLKAQMEERFVEAGHAGGSGRRR
jgi:DNA-binding transcriptional LysR family regulator